MSTFKVSWSSDDKAVQGKVFAKKRKATKTAGEKFQAFVQKETPKKTHGNTEKVEKSKGFKVTNKLDTGDFVENPTKKVLKKSRAFKSSDVASSISNKISTKLVKRKKNKDRLAAKLATQTGSHVKVQNSLKTPNTHSLFSVGTKDIYVKPNLQGKPVIEEVFSTGKKFSDLYIHKYIVSNLEKIGFTTLTTVQDKSIPVILSGKNVLIRSQTGSGKTLAYAVPTLNALQNINPRLQRNDGVQAVIITPTRELALQTHEIFGKINTFQWIVVGHLCGGENRNTEKSRLRKGTHILIATPGRLLDHLLHTSSFKTSNVRSLILDEADRLLDMGFKRDIVRIVEEIDKSKTHNEYDPMALLKQHKEGSANSDTTDLHKDDVNKTRQTILLSATLSKGIAELADFAMKDHTYIDALEEAADLSPELIVIPISVKQKYLITHVKHRLFTLSAILVAQAEKSSKTFVFMGTSIMVDYHYELFTRFLIKMPRNRGKLKSGDVVLLDGLENDSDDNEEVVLDIEFFKLHGSMDQSARKDVFTRFRAAKSGVLLCTDVVARGIDVPTADCIIQYNGPQNIEDYLHRVGRTGRAGKPGTSYIFLTHEEQEFVTKLEEHKVYLQEQNSDIFLKHLCILMEEEDQQTAAIVLQRHYENSIAGDKEFHKMACLDVNISSSRPLKIYDQPRMFQSSADSASQIIAYSSWSRFYNTYSNKMRAIFDFKNANLGHYVTSFGLKETPTEVARIVKGQVSKVEPPRLNKKLNIHEEEAPKHPPPKRKIKSLSLTTSEFSSGLEPKKKKKKNSVKAYFLCY